MKRTTGPNRNRPRKRGKQSTSQRNRRIREKLEKQRNSNMDLPIEDLKPFLCEACGKAFTHQKDLDSHLSVHKDNLMLSPVPESSIDRSSPQHECDMCKAHFKSEDDLTIHQALKCEDKPFPCEVCRKLFSSKKSLKNHQRTKHGKEKPFCEICSKAFTSKSYLKSHRRVHTGEKPFECELCSVKFAYRTSLDSHMLIHSNEKPFECPKCLKGFKTMSLFKKHNFDKCKQIFKMCTTVLSRETVTKTYLRKASTVFEESPEMH